MTLQVHNPHIGTQQLRKGRVELLAGGLSCHWIDVDDYATGFHAFLRPVILQSGNASCTYRATEDAIGSLSVESLGSVWKDIPCSIYCEQPDGCGVSLIHFYPISLSLGVLTYL